MEVCLISPPIVTELEGNTTTRADRVRVTAEPPLGILSLAALVEEMGITPRIFDINRLFSEMAEATGPDARIDVYAEASKELAGIEADVFGFGTLTGSYPLTIRLAAAAKQSHPKSLIVLGGPQASALDRETLEAFSFIDFVVRGEADETFPQLLETVRSSKPPNGLAGLTYRRDGRVVCEPDAPVVAALDDLPTPAFHLWPEIRKYPGLSMEAGRGCPFACSFCSSSTFFRRQYRMKSPARVIEQMKSIRQAHGISSFHLVHDTFTAHRENVIAFCTELLKSDEHFRWTCSARTDCVDRDLLQLMQKAGCNGIFFGVETGSVRMQQAIGKRLDLDRALEAIRHAHECRVENTVSLITGFPDETPEDVRSTVRFLIDSLRFERVTGQLHLLAPVAGSPLHHQFRKALVWDGIFSDLTIQNWGQESADHELIRRYPQVFPDFHAIPTRFLDRYYLVELRDFIIYGVARCRWLLIALHQQTGDLLRVFNRWREWRTQNKAPRRADTAYYASADFRSNLLEFVGAVYVTDGNADSIGVTTVLEYEIGRARLGGVTPDAALSSDRRASISDNHAVPCLAPGVAIMHLSADYRSIIDRLRRGKSLRDVPRNPVVVAEKTAPRDSVEVVQISPLSSALIDLCDGKRTVAQIAEFFPKLQEGLDQFPKEEACLFALNDLIRQGLLVASA